MSKAEDPELAVEVHLKAGTDVMKRLLPPLKIGDPPKAGSCKDILEHVFDHIYLHYALIVLLLVDVILVIGMGFLDNGFLMSVNADYKHALTEVALALLPIRRIQNHRTISLTW